jgi:tRNA 2-thiouridine synthesizing protein E
MLAGNRDIQLDKDGFMVEPALWNEEIAKAIASDEGIEQMSEDHWKVANYIRQYWQKNDIAPAVRLICTELNLNVRQIYKLYTSGPARGACRVAGLPKPDGCV